MTTAPKFNFEDEVLVYTPKGTLVGIVQDREICEDHENYYVGTGNSLTSRWYDVTQLQKLETSILIEKRKEAARIQTVYP